MKRTAWIFLGMVLFTGNAQCADTGANIGHANTPSTEPVTGQDWARMGDHALGADNKEKAIEYYTKAIEAYTSDGETYPVPFLYSNRATLYVGFEKYQQAIEDYTSAIKLKPDFFEAYRMRGNIYDKLGNHQQALADYAKHDELVKESHEAANRNKTPEEKECDARFFAYLMAISGKSSAENNKIREQAMQIIATHKNDKSCETVKELDVLFGQK